MADQKKSTESDWGKKLMDQAEKKTGLAAFLALVLGLFTARGSDDDGLNDVVDKIEYEVTKKSVQLWHGTRDALRNVVIGMGIIGGSILIVCIAFIVFVWFVDPRMLKAQVGLGSFIVLSVIVLSVYYANLRTTIITAVGSGVVMSSQTLRTWLYAVIEGRRDIGTTASGDLASRFEAIEVAHTRLGSALRNGLKVIVDVGVWFYQLPARALAWIGGGMIFLILIDVHGEFAYVLGVLALLALLWGTILGWRKDVRLKAPASEPSRILLKLLAIVVLAVVGLVCEADEAANLLINFPGRPPLGEKTTEHLETTARVIRQYFVMISGLVVVWIGISVVGHAYGKNQARRYATMAIFPLIATLLVTSIFKAHVQFSDGWVKWGVLAVLIVGAGGLSSLIVGGKSVGGILVKGVFISALMLVLTWVLFHRFGPESRIPDPRAKATWQTAPTTSTMQIPRPTPPPRAPLVTPPSWLQDKIQEQLTDGYTLMKTYSRRQLDDGAHSLSFGEGLNLYADQACSIKHWPAGTIFWRYYKEGTVLRMNEVITFNGDKASHQVQDLTDPVPPARWVLKDQDPLCPYFRVEYGGVNKSKVGRLWLNTSIAYEAEHEVKVLQLGLNLPEDGRGKPAMGYGIGTGSLLIEVWALVPPGATLSAVAAH